MYEKENFQNELEFNADGMLKQQKKEHQEMLNSFKLLEPKIDKIAEWHKSSDDRHLIPDVYRELLIGWYMSNKGLTINWIDKEYNSIEIN